MRWRLARGLAVAAGVLLCGAAVLVGAELVVRPGPVERVRFDQVDAHGDGGEPIAMPWSIDTYSDVVYTEGPPGLAARSQIRLVRQDRSLGGP